MIWGNSLSKIAAVLLVSCFSSVLMATGEAPEAKPFLQRIFSDNMVLQRDLEVPVWGWAKPGETVTVEFAGQKKTATAGDASNPSSKDSTLARWMVKLKPMPASSEPRTMKVSSSITNQKSEIKNILIGDVWLCSGQSNMQFSVSECKGADEDIAGADFPLIRHFCMPRVTSANPSDKISGDEWQVCTPKTVRGFTAVGYFFARHLYKELKIPIGLLNSSWGGTAAQAWTSEESLRTMPDFAQIPNLDTLKQLVAENKIGEEYFETVMAEYWRKNDPGSTEGMEWSDPALDISDWKTIKVPGVIEEAGLPNFDGVVWFRKNIDLGDEWLGRELMLEWGPIRDTDTSFINRIKVGSLYGNGHWRYYPVPKGVAKAGTNTIAVRLLNRSGQGGFVGRPEVMRLRTKNPGKPLSVPLAGDYLYKTGKTMKDMEPVPVRLDGSPGVPTVLYNAMIAPLVPFAIKGAIWYQGEANSGQGMQYRTLLPKMIGDWRSKFGVGDFPFLVVQLANFMAQKDKPEPSAWATLREAQALTAMRTAKVGLAVAIDIGDATNIHPSNKQDVGRRLGLAAQSIAYGQKIVYSGPIYKSMKQEGKSIRLSFDHVGGGLVSKGDKLEGFAIAGEAPSSSKDSAAAGGKFVWADAVIDGDSIVVSSPDVEKPVAVRYAWADNPVCNLYNKEGLPAVPFRTDTEAKQ